MARGSGFINPQTISDDNEWNIPPLPVYLTFDEWIPCGLVLPVGYMLASLALIPVTSNSLPPLAVGLILSYVMAIQMSRYKQGKPASWLFDLQYQFGFGAMKPRTMRCSSKLRWLYAHPIAKPSVYICGTTKPGRELTTHQFWQNYSNHIHLPYRLMRPRTRIKLILGKNQLAPAFMHGSVGWEKTVNPTIPISWTRVTIDPLDP